MAVFNFNGIKGLTKGDRELWEKQNIDKLNSMGYGDFDEENKIKAFKNALFKDRFGSNKDYDKLKTLSAQERDSMLLRNMVPAKTYENNDTITTNTTSDTPSTVSTVLSNKVKEHSINVATSSDYAEIENKDNIIKERWRRDRALSSIISPEMAPYYESFFNGQEQNAVALENFYSGALFKKGYEDLKKLYSKSAQTEFADIEKTKKIAQEKSRQYQFYTNKKINYLNINSELIFNRLPLTDEDWRIINLNYNSILESRGEKEAIAYMDSYFADMAARNTSIGAALGKDVMGLGTLALGSLVTYAGMIYGGIKYLAGLPSGSYKENPNFGALDNLMLSMADNVIFKVGSNIAETGTFIPWQMEELQKLGMNIWDHDLQSRKTGFTKGLLWTSSAFKNQGFTIASILSTLGAGAVVKGGASLVARKILPQVIKASLKTAKNAAKVQKAFNFVDAGMLPFLSSLNEGLFNGAETRKLALKDGYNMLQSAHEKIVQEDIKKTLENYIPIEGVAGGKEGEMYFKNKKTGVILSLSDIHKEAWDNRKEEFEDSRKQVEFAADKVAVDEALIDTSFGTLTGWALQSTIFNPRVTQLLKKSKAFKIFQPVFDGFKVTGKGASAIVAPYLSNIRVGAQTLREPVAEMLQEGQQEFVSAFTHSAALNNIEEFINARYNTNSAFAVGTTFSSDWNAGLEGAGRAFRSGRITEAAIMGAVGTFLGTPYKSSRITRTKRDSKGNILLDKDGKPITEKVWFGRGIKADGTQETNWDIAARLMPWRSPIVQSYRQAKSEKQMNKARAAFFQSWLRDPENQARWDGAVGTFSFTERFIKSMEGKDGFTARNAMYGELLNDAFILRALRNTDVYTAHINRLNEMANLEEGSEEASKLLTLIRNTSPIYDGMEDAEILRKIKENANNMLDIVQNKVPKALDKVESLFGDMDIDAKQAIVFGMLSDEDWTKREEEIREKIKELRATNSRENNSKISQLNAEQKAFIAKNGSLSTARKKLEEDKKKLESLKKDIERLEEKQEKTKEQKKTLKEKKQKVKELEETVKKNDSLLNSLPTVPVESTQEDGTTVLSSRELTDEDLILNEEEIMALDPIKRKNFLLAGAKKRYVATHNGQEAASRLVEEKSPYSPEQQAVIDNLISQLGDEAFDDIVDLGRIQEARNDWSKQFSNIVYDSKEMLKFIDTKKKEFARQLIALKYKHLKNITDYKEMKKELDELYKTGSIQDLIVVTGMLKNNDLYKRYKEQQRSVENLVQQLDNSGVTAGLNYNDLNLTKAITRFLVDNEINLKDEEAVTNALFALNESTGNSAITDYINNYNEGRKVQISLENIGEVFEVYKKGIKAVNSNQQVRNRIVQPAPKPVGDSVPQEESKVFSGNAEQKPAEAPKPAESTDRKGKPLAVGDTVYDNETKGFMTVKEIKDGKVVVVNSAGTEYTYNQETAHARFSKHDKPLPAKSKKEGPKETPKETEEDSTKKEEDLENAEEEQQKDSKASQDSLNLDKAKNESLVEAIENSFKGLKGTLKRILLGDSSLQAFLSFINNLDSSMPFEDFVNAIKKEIQRKENGKNVYSGNVISNVLGIITNITTSGKNTFEEKAKDRAKAKEEERKKQGQALTRNEGPQRGLVFVDPTQAYPNTSLASLFVRSGSAAYISDGRLVRKRMRKTKGGKDEEVRPMVRFLYIPTSAQQFANDLGDSYNEAEDALIIAVYPMTEEEANNPNYQGIAIPGTTTKYMPIGILPSSKESGTQGYEYAKEIRRLALLNKENPHFVMNGTTNITGVPAVHSPALSSSNNSATDRDVTTSIQEMRDREAASMQEQDKNLSKEEANIKALKKILSKIKNRLAVITIEAKRGALKMPHKVLTYVLKDLKGGETNHILYIKDLHELKDENLGLGIKEFIEQGFPLTEFNYIFELFPAQLSEFLKKELQGNKSFGDINNQALTTWLNKYLYYAAGYSIKENEDGGYSLFAGNNEITNIYLDDSGEATFDVEALLKNLILSDGDFRQGLKIQVDYEAMLSDSNRGYEVFNRIMLSGILRIGLQDPNWERPNKTVFCEVPSGLNVAIPEIKSTTTTNPDNANFSGANTGKILTPSGEHVDTETGTNDNGEIPSNPIENRRKIAQDAVDAIIEESKGMRLTEDEKQYENKNHTLFERVTSFIKGFKEEIESVFKTPSTHIGLTADDFIRDFFVFSNVENKVFTEEDLDRLFVEHEDTKTRKVYLQNSETKKVYYNVSKTYMRQFAKEVVHLQRYFKERGLTIIPNDITLTGTLTNEKGETFNIAGTLDILAIDANGNLHIFDMKTHLWSYDGIYYEDKDSYREEHGLPLIPDEQKRINLEAYKEHWGKQLSAYKKLLEDNPHIAGTGIRVVECGIIPIKTTYPSPYNGNNYTSADPKGTPKNKKTNQLLLNGQQFSGATLSLDLLGTNPEGNQVFEPIPISGEYYHNTKSSVKGTINKNDKAPVPIVESKGYEEGGAEAAGNGSSESAKSWEDLNIEEKHAIVEKYRKKLGNPKLKSSEVKKMWEQDQNSAEQDKTEHCP